MRCWKLCHAPRTGVVLCTICTLIQLYRAVRCVCVHAMAQFKNKQQLKLTTASRAHKRSRSRRFFVRSVSFYLGKSHARSHFECNEHVHPLLCVSGIIISTHSVRCLALGCIRVQPLFHNALTNHRCEVYSTNRQSAITQNVYIDYRKTNLFSSNC